MVNKITFVKVCKHLFSKECPANLKHHFFSLALSVVSLMFSIFVLCYNNLS